MAAVEILNGLSVVDCGVGMPAALVSKFLAEFGARVVRIEPPDGDPFHARYPAYEVWRGGADVRKATDVSPEQFERLLADADVCIVGGEDHPQLQRLVDAAALAGRHGRLVVLDIRGYPSNTADTTRPAADVLVQARSGLANEQLTTRPILMGFEPCNYGAALQGLLGIFAALYEREASGRGQLVETSLYEGALTWLTPFWAQFQKRSPITDFVMPRDPYPTIFRCADGQYIHFVTGSAGSKYLTYQALEIDDPRVKPGDAGLPDLSHPKKFFGPVDLYAEHCARKTSTEILERMWARSLPVNRVLPPGACWSEPQIQANGTIVQDPDGTRHVGIPYRLQLSAGSAPKPPRSGTRPLDGVRVVDFGAFVAGPLASGMLTDLGADVIKIEPLAGDPARRAAFRNFSAANRGKRAIALDLKNPAALRIARSVVETADVVTSNFRPGVAARLGIDPPSLHAIRPGLVVLESPAYGAQGPLFDRAGFDMVMQALCGHEYRGGGVGNEPLWNRTATVDTAAGALGAIAVVAGLYHRARTGDGVFIESALVSAGIYLLSELIQRPGGEFAGGEPMNSSRTGYRPTEALYQTRDGWIAVAARGDDAPKRLAEALGLEQTLRGPAARWQADEHAAIAAVLAGRTTAQTLEQLTRAEVWVEECRDGQEAEVLQDAQLLALGTVRSSRHPTHGEIRELGALMRFSRSRTGNGRPAPLLGESTSELLRELGFDEARIAELRARHVVN